MKVVPLLHKLSLILPPSEKPTRVQTSPHRLFAYDKLSLASHSMQARPKG